METQEPPAEPASEQFYPGTTLQRFWDNTSISIFKDCPRKYYYAIVEGWRTQGKAPALEWGKAWHEVTALYDMRLAEGEALEASLVEALRLAYSLSEEGFGDDGNYRTRNTLLRSLIWYADQFKNDPIKTAIFDNGSVGLELSFRFDLGFAPAIPGAPNFAYCGHIDKLADYNGSLFVVERKHTTQSLGDHLFSRYMFSAQVSGYVAAAKIVFLQDIGGVIIEATQVQVNRTNFARRAVHRVHDHLDEWVSDTQFWIKQVESCWHAGAWPHNTESCNKYAGCQFRKVCAKSPATRELELETYFVKDRWDPTKER